MGVWIVQKLFLAIALVLPNAEFALGVVDWLEEQEVVWVRDALTNGTLRNGFSTYSETDRILSNTAKEFPHLLTSFTIGKSYEGLPISAYLLSRNPIISDMHRRDPGTLQIPREVPQILLTALHHAREPASLSVVVYCLLRLIAESAKDEVHPVVQHILDNVAIVAVPFVNPDGYVAIEETHNYSIRKNRRPTCQKSAGPQYEGVDLNRNYGYHFENSHTGCDPEEYEGDGAFSEPETQAIRALAEANHFRFALNFHAYGGSWTHPYNCCNDTELSSEVTDVFKELQSILRVKQFERAPRVESLLYTTTGEADDWFLSELNVLSLSPEVGLEKDGFWPPKSAILPLCRRNFERVVNIAVKCDTEFSSLSLHMRLPDLQNSTNATTDTGFSSSDSTDFFVNVDDGGGKNPSLGLNIPLSNLWREASHAYASSKKTTGTRVSSNPNGNSVMKDIIFYNSGLSGGSENFFLALFRTDESVSKTSIESVGAFVPRWSFVESGEALISNLRRVLSKHTALVYAEEEKACTYVLLDADGVRLPNVVNSDDDAGLRQLDTNKSPLMFRMPSMEPRSRHITYLYSPDVHCLQVLSSVCVVQSPDRASYDPQRAQYEALASCHCGSLETPTKFSVDFNSTSADTEAKPIVALSVPLTEWKRAALHIQKPSSDGRCRAATRRLFFSEPSILARGKAFAANSPQVLMIDKGYFASAALVAAIFEVLLLLLAGGCCLRIAWELFLDNESGLKPWIRKKCASIGKWLDFALCCLKALPFLRKKNQTTARPRRRKQRSPQSAVSVEETSLKGKTLYGHPTVAFNGADDKVELALSDDSSESGDYPPVIIRV